MPTVLPHMNLEVCQAAYCLMSITIKYPFERGPHYLHMWNPTWTPITCILPIVEVSGKEGDNALYTSGCGRRWNPPVDIYILTSVWRTRTLRYTPWALFCSLCTKQFKFPHPCICIDWSTLTKSRMLRQREISISLQMRRMVSKFPTLVELGHATKCFLEVRYKKHFWRRLNLDLRNPASFWFPLALSW